MPDAGPSDAARLDATRPPRPDGGQPGEWMTRSGERRPSPRSFASVGVDVARRRAILFGGWDGDPFDDTWARDLDTGAWTPLAATGPSPRSEASAMVDVARDRFIVAGGHRDGLTVALDAWALDLVSDTWSELPPPPRGFGSTSVATDGARMWLLVGASEIGHEASIFELDLARDSLRHVADRRRRRRAKRSGAKPSPRSSPRPRPRSFCCRCCREDATAPRHGSTTRDGC